MELLANRYQIVRSIGQGGMGVVYEGVDRQTNRPVAIKQLHARDIADPTAIERFRREAYATAQLHHPHIIEFLDFVPGAEPAIVLELLQGETLRQALGRQPTLPIEQTVRVAGHVLAALEAAHRAGIVHRDLKPANVFLTATGQTKLLDFGVAKLLEAQGPALTRASHVVGSATYMAPEQIRGAAVDGRTDLFAFGLCLYEMLTGQKPYDGGSMHQAMLRIMQGEPVPAHPALAPQLLEFLRTATHPDPARRYATALQMNDALNAALYATGTAQQRFDPGMTSGASFVQHAPKSKSRAPLLLGLAALGLVGAAAAGAAVWLRSPDVPAPVVSGPPSAASVVAASVAPSAKPAASTPVAATTARKPAAADAGAANRSAADAGMTPTPPEGARGSRKPCTDNAQCAASELCYAADAHPYECQTCAEAQRATYCGEPHKCANLKGDLRNCGACGQRCGFNETCSGGKCLLKSPPNGACQTVMQCPASQQCVTGQCRCSGTMTFCPSRGVCLDKCP